jgi:hypothetical protein
MECSTPRISDEEIKEFMKISKSEKDDSIRCRQIIGQLISDLEYEIRRNVPTLKSSAPSQTEEAQNTVGQQAALSEGETPNGKTAS